MSAIARVLTLCVLLVLSSSAALAQDVPLALHWTAPDACPSGAEVLDEVRGMVALSEAGATHAVEASVNVERLSQGGFRAHIHSERDGVQGERALMGPSCSALAHAVALVLALSLGADVLAPPPEPPPALSEKPPLAPAPPAREPEKAPVHAPERWRLTLGGEFVVATGMVPGVGVGAGPRLGLEYRLLALELRAGMFAPKRVHVPGNAGAEAHFHAGYLALQGCYQTPRPMKVGVLGCGGVELAGARGASTGVSEPGSALAFWPRGFLALGLRADLPRALALRLEGQGGRAWAIPRFAVKGQGGVYEPETYAFRLLLGLDKHF
jgi:hypothetical protein